MRFYQGLGYSLRWFLKIIVGIDYKAQGLEHLDYQRKQGPCIIASKHQSMWETIMLSIFFPRVVVVLKKELLRIPIYGQYLKRLQSIAIDRKNGISAIRKIVHDGQKAVKIGRDLLIFPEGTRSNIGDKVSYQVGVAILYEKLGVNVLPVALNSGIFWPRRQILKKPGTIIVEFLPPIKPGLDKKTFLKQLEHDIEEKCQQLYTNS